MNEEEPLGTNTPPTFTIRVIGVTREQRERRNAR
jgi:hypothetical protein